MKVPMGPHQRRGRRRRRGKALALCVVLAGMAVTASWTEGSPRGTPVAWGEEEPRAARGLPLAADHDSAQASDDENAASGAGTPRGGKAKY